MRRPSNEAHAAAAARLKLQTSIIDRLAIISETDPRGVITHINENRSGSAAPRKGEPLDALALDLDGQLADGILGAGHVRVDAQ